LRNFELPEALLSECIAKRDLLPSTRLAMLTYPDLLSVTETKGIIQAMKHYDGTQRITVGGIKIDPVGDPLTI
jgi:hypothetical protein